MASRVVASCVVFVQGTTMPCPLCRKTVRSGEHHECRIEKVGRKAQREQNKH